MDGAASAVFLGTLYVIEIKQRERVNGKLSGTFCVDFRARVKIDWHYIFVITNRLICSLNASVDRASSQRTNIYMAPKTSAVVGNLRIKDFAAHKSLLRNYLIPIYSCLQTNRLGERL